MLITSEIYIGDDDQVDWEPDSTGENLILHFGKAGYARGCKLQLSNKIVNEMISILVSLGYVYDDYTLRC